jgi:hypothetical protein
LTHENDELMRQSKIHHVGSLNSTAPSNSNLYFSGSDTDSDVFTPKPALTKKSKSADPIASSGNNGELSVITSKSSDKKADLKNVQRNFMDRLIDLTQDDDRIIQEEIEERKQKRKFNEEAHEFEMRKQQKLLDMEEKRLEMEERRLKLQEKQQALLDYFITKENK